MPGFFSRLKGRNNNSKIKENPPQSTNLKSALEKVKEDAWARKSVDPEEVQDLLHGCLQELKARGLEVPFLLLPFRPTFDTGRARTFIRHFFENNIRGEVLSQELKLTEPMDLCSVIKWCWSRIPGGVVGWDAYELFRIGETDSNMARYSFATFIPLSVDSEARSKIIFDFFDLLSAIAANSKSNGFGGRKLSRLAGWWAFEQSDDGNGFEGGYKKWLTAADATCHLFFAHLRSLSPESTKGLSSISRLPVSLQKLVQETEYPPQPSKNMQTKTSKVLMIVDSVSPTPFSLLRRANNFEYRYEDKALMEFAEYEDPVTALTDECRRVLHLISAANQSNAPYIEGSVGITDVSWTKFEDLGFTGAFNGMSEGNKFGIDKRRSQGLRRNPRTRPMGGRPTTPSWADFLSSGFVNEVTSSPSLLLPPDLTLPPIDVQKPNSQPQRLSMDESRLGPGEVASVSTLNIDDAFWWVWICSLAGEEYAERKAVFGRCALLETVIPSGRWLLMEEKVKGAASTPEEGAYIVEKKRFWNRSKKGKIQKPRKSGDKLSNKVSLEKPNFITPPTSASTHVAGAESHARIQAAAAKLQQKQKEESQEPLFSNPDDSFSMKTSSVFTLQPLIKNEASPAMKWANNYDKNATREAYLANFSTGRGRQDPIESNTRPKSEEIPRNGGLEDARPTSTSAVEEDIRESLPDRGYSASACEMRPTDQELETNQSQELGKSSSKNSGIKKFFSKGKSSCPRNAGPPPQVSHGREAIERKFKGPSLGRSWSGLRKKSLTPTGRRSAVPSPSTVDQTFDHGSRSVSPAPPAIKLSRSNQVLSEKLSRVDTKEEQLAHQAFSNFDQGLVENVPAFFPSDSSDDETDEFTPPQTRQQVSSDTEPSPIEKWAQIKQTALEKLAARQNEELNSSNLNLPIEADDEEVGSSEEETIESRVARIKARVAQLTGNTEDGSSPIPARSRPVES